MATSKKFSELPVASSMNNGDLFAVAQEDAQAETGYTSKSATALVVGKKLNGEIEYATDLPSFPPGDQNPLDALEYLNSKINDLYPVDSATGSIVNFTTSLALPLVALKTNIVAQGGGGTPSSPVAITGFSEVNVTRAGKNLINFTDFSTYSNWKTDIASGGEVPTGTGNRGYVLNTRAGVTYTISFGINSTTFPTYLYLCKTDSSGNSSKLTNITTDSFRISNYTFTADSDIYYLRMGYLTTESAFDTQIEKISYAQLEIGSQATAYIPYNPQSDTFTLNLGQTIYGGYVDWENGSAKKTYGYLTIDDTINWDMNETSNYRYFDAVGVIADSYSWNINTVCNIAGKQGGGYPYCQFNGQKRVRFVTSLSDTIDTVEKLKNVLSQTPMQVAYELATPIEIDLPTTMPTTIEGVQNWFADSGDIELEYKMGVQEYIDKKIAEVQALVL